MDYELVHKDVPLTIQAQVNVDSIVLVNGERKTVWDYVTADGVSFLVTTGGRTQRLVAVKDGDTVYVATAGGEFRFKLPPSPDADTVAEVTGGIGDKSKLVPPMPGKVVKVLVREGQQVRAKEKLVIVEAMKMENPLVAPYAAEVVKLNCTEGQLVDTEDVLVELRKLDDQGQ